MTLQALTLQRSRDWFDMILAQNFPSFWGIRSLLADLYALSFHELSEHENKGNVYRHLITDFPSLDRN